MSEKSTASSSGIGFFGLLAIVFIVLKLTGVIHWSWWWVTAPLWGGIVALAAFMLVMGVIALIGFAVSAIAKNF